MPSASSPQHCDSVLELWSIEAFALNGGGIRAVHALDSDPIMKVHVSCTTPYGSAGKAQHAWPYRKGIKWAAQFRNHHCLLLFAHGWSPAPEVLLTWGMQSSCRATATLLSPGACMEQREKLTHAKSSPTSQILVSAWLEAWKEKEDLFPFQCFLCCQHHILFWPCRRLHFGLIITEHGLLIQVVDSNQSFSIKALSLTF